MFAQLTEEKDSNKHAFGITRVHDRAQYYFGILSSTLCGLLQHEDFPQPEDVENRDRGVVIPKEDEEKIHPAILDLIKGKIPITVNNILTQMKSTHQGWT